MNLNYSTVNHLWLFYNNLSLHKKLIYFRSIENKEEHNSNFFFIIASDFLSKINVELQFTGKLVYHPVFVCTYLLSYLVLITIKSKNSGRFATTKLLSRLFRLFLGYDCAVRFFAKLFY